MKIVNQKSLQMLILISLLSAASTQVFGGYEIQVRVFVSETANLILVRNSINSIGGRVQEFTPEQAFVVLIDSDAVTSLASINGVKTVFEVIGPSLLPLAVPTSPAMGDRPPTPEEQHDADQASSPVTSVILSDFAKNRALLQGLLTRPSKVDNSFSIYFPPIGNQAHQDCTAWATCYYFNSYTQAKGENINITGGINDPFASSYITSPAFLYNLDNRNSDGGAVTQTEVTRLNNVGCASFKYMPYKDTDFLTWPSGDAWINAINFRTKSPTITYNLSLPNDVEALKNTLANGNVAVTRADVYSNWASWFGGTDPGGINNGVLFSHSGFSYVGGHALTFVGYDDNRPYINNGVTKKGAFLVANSWSPYFGTYNSSGSGTRGFMWIAYDYATNYSNKAFNVAYWNNDLDSRYRPSLYARSGLNHLYRGMISFTGGLGSSSDIIWSYDVLNPYGKNIPTQIMITQDNPIAVDLSDETYLSSRINGHLPIDMFVNMVNYSTSVAGQIATADFYHKNDVNNFDLLPNSNYTRITSPSTPVPCPSGRSCFAEATIPVSYYLNDITLTGPVVATLGATYGFAAQANPLTSGTPITYSWQATDYPNTSHQQTGHNADTLKLNWSTTGSKQVAVTATNSYNSVTSQTHTVSVQALRISNFTFITCPDGIAGLELTISGTSAMSTYEVYFRSSLIAGNWLVAETGISGMDGNIKWRDCQGAGFRSNTTGFYTVGLADDSDGDGLGDSYEVKIAKTDPTNLDSDNNGINDGDEDFDNDLLSNVSEYNKPSSQHYNICRFGSSDPRTKDTDNDGYDDWVDHFPVDPSAWFDPDCDGKPNQQVTVSSLSRPPLVADKTVNLTVVKGGFGSGKVIGDGLDCGATCTAAYYDSNWVRLKVLPDPNSVLLGWTGGDCYGRGDCNVKMDKERIVSAIIGLIGDTNSDGRVDCTDLAIVRTAFGKKQGQAGFDLKADVNFDGVVDIRDLSIVSRLLPTGTKCS